MQYAISDIHHAVDSAQIKWTLSFKKMEIGKSCNETYTETNAVAEEGIESFYGNSRWKPAWYRTVTDYETWASDLITKIVSNSMVITKMFEHKVSRSRALPSRSPPSPDHVWANGEN